MKIIYIRGGDKHAPHIAEASGMEYGIRGDYIAYATVYMVDVNFKAFQDAAGRFVWNQPEWDRYLEIVKCLRPHQALAVDYMPGCPRDLLWKQIWQLSSLIERVIVCPKFHGALDDLPNDAQLTIGISVPAPTYAGFVPELDRLAGRDIHLLGGSPESQAKLITRLNGVGAAVVSTDISFHAMKAAKGQFFRNGKWVDVRGEGHTTEELTIESGRGIVKYLHAANLFRQPLLSMF